MAEAPIKNIAKPTITFVKDSIIGSKRLLKIVISPNRNVNRYDVFVHNMTIQNLKANNVKSLDFETKIGGKISNKLLSYYVVDNLPLEMEFMISANQKIDMNFVESSFDLMNNPLFTMIKRRDWMIATPFVLNDAVVITQKIKPTTIIENVEKPNLNRRSAIANDSSVVKNDSLQ